MSGGVDSSVAATLVARSGRNLVGFSMQLIDRLAGEKQRYGKCCSPEDFQDARRVAERIGFPHYIIDMEEDFMRQVLEPFAADYARGMTPSPCVRCNTFLKFGSLVGRARAVGAEKVVTGHYAILEADPKTGRTLMRRAVDREKDQTYFLFDLSETQRKFAEFPLGELTKDEVRALAHENNLTNADKPESMDLCFVAEGEGYRDFLSRQGLAPDARPGSVVNASGKKLGQHEGVEGFTVGQRRGLGISADRALYVIQVRPETSEVVVGDDADLLRDRCVFERSRFLPFEKLAGGEELRAEVRIRSTHEGSPALLRGLGEGRTEVVFDEPQRAITPGQAAVAYDGDLVLGGGWIERDPG
jgi:tRNA-specific 2-thiouridylase